MSWLPMGPTRLYAEASGCPATRMLMSVWPYAATRGSPGPGRLDIRFVPGRLWPSYGWLFTGGDGHANVGVGTFDATTRPNRRELEELLSRLFPDVQVEPDSIGAHRLPLSSARPVLTASGVLLVGDAAALVSPMTGEGIHAALLSGMLAGRACVGPKNRPATRTDGY